MKTLSLAMAAAFALVLSIATPASAHEHMKMAKAGDLVISDFWARATPPSAKTGAAFMVIKNTGATDDVLIGAASSIAKDTQIHETQMEGGVMKMRHVGKIAIPAGGMATLKPGSFHIMFVGLHKPVKEGDTIALTLTFEKSGSVELMVKAQKSMGKTMGNGDKPMDHGTMKTN